MKTCPWSLLSCFLPGLILLLSLAPNCSLAQTADPVMQVEQDWEILISEPDPASGSPEISLVISPTAGMTGNYGVFALNYESSAGFAKGGFENQIWNGRQLLSARGAQDLQVLANENELIELTQVIRFNRPETKLIYEIRDLKSTTWGTVSGTFASQERVTASLSGLDQYAVQTSIDTSGVNAGGNRVAYILLKSARLTHESGAVTTIQVNCYIHLGGTGTLLTETTTTAKGLIIPRNPMEDDQ